MAKKQSKKKKEKVIYIDDGSTVADMSGVRGDGKKSTSSGSSASKGSGRAREIFRTYIESVKLMFLPMLVVLGIIAIAFLLVYFIL